LNAGKALAAVATAAVWSCIASGSHAQEASPCAARVTRTNVVACALAASLQVEQERRELEAAQARKTAAGPLLPANPVLELSLARRTAPSNEATNWSATLSQELEIAGQRGARRDSAAAAVAAQSKRVVLSRRETASQAWIAFFDALAARAAQRLAGRFATAIQALSTVASARAEQGLIAAVDADVADALAVQALQAQLAADRRVTQSTSVLLSMLGLDPAQAVLAVEGELLPLDGVGAAFVSSASRALAERPEVLVLEAERRVQESRASALRRSRVPNPTISLFAQKDGIDERVWGAGIAFPIPLPGNLGRTYSGEIAEAEALARRALSQAQRAERQIRLEIAVASQAFQSRDEEVQAFSPARVARAEASLVSLAEEVQSGRLAVRDAVLAEQTLIELLRSSIEARREWCVASVTLAEALGLALEGRSP